MSGRPVLPGRLRNRLTVAFVLVALVSAAVLAVTSFFLVRQARLADSLERAEADARFQLVVARQFLPLDPRRRDELLTSFEQTGHHVVLVADGRATPSNPRFDPPLSSGLRSGVAAGELRYERRHLDGRHLLVVGGRIPGSTAELYLVSTEDRISADLEQLRTVLIVGGVAVVVLAALVGRTLARRTLEPVGRASDAARAITEGLLDTRLPAGGEDEFGAWATSFNQMAAALQAKVAALSEAQARERRFTADVAHELRTPVTALVAAGSLLREHLEALPAGASRPAELLVDNVVRLRHLIDELMEISRLDAGEEAVRPQPVDLTALLEAIVRSRGWDEQVRLDDPGGVTLTTDPRRLERVVGNLVSNAVEHGGGNVTVAVTTADGEVCVRVADQGPGIAAEHLPRLFDRFYKADSARAGAGSGLGLAIAAENARLLGGEVSVRSALGEGTEFRLTLPV